MKRYDMLVAAYTLLATVFIVISSCLSGFAQNCPPSNTMPEFEAFTYTPVQSWNTSAYQSWQYHKPSDPNAADYMRFRMLVPNGFDRCATDGKKYPLIIFLHGSGESAPYDAAPNNGVGEQDNDKHLVHGGQKHRDAVANNTFPGFVIYPQIRKASNGNNYWGIDNLEAVRYIIDKLIADYKVDPDRVYLHGLSMGGEGTWIFIANHPRYFAAAHPMSAAGSNFWNGSTGDRNVYKHLPLRHAQGGLDSNPTKAQGNEMVEKIREIGGNIRYSYYPNGGHSIWNNEYNKSDFFSWFLGYRKYYPWIENQQTSFCPGDNFSVKLGFTAGFDEYQWTKNDTTSGSFSSANEVTITQAVSAGSGVGTYYGRFRRGATWTRWSPPIIIDSNKGPSPTPTITPNGSVNLPALDGSPEVILSGPTNKAVYNWSVVPTATLPATQNITVSTAGSYTLKTKDAAATGYETDGVTPTEYRGAPQGCLSNASSPVVVTTSNGVDVPPPPGNFFASASTPTSIVLSWDDRSSNETGFEIYRTTTPGSGYKLIALLPASSSPNPQTYTDNSNVLANTIYYYVMRAVNTFGGSTYTPEISVSTTIDNIKPTAPVLSVGLTSRTEINLSWTGATDNVAVFEYDIYQDGSLIATVPATITTYKATGLIAFSTHNYIVRVRDLTGNTSAPSNQVTASAINTGLYYSYYHHDGLLNTGEILTKGTLIKTGVVSNFTTSPKTRPNNFAFIYDGYITIPTTGTYTFYLSVDDGGRLFINNTLVVNHDNTHGCTERSGTITLSAGNYPISALQFQNTGGDCISVKWQGPGIPSKVTVPDAALRDNLTPPASVANPSNFRVTASTHNSVSLAWNDNSNNETAFEIYRLKSTNGVGTYQVVNTTTANTTSWVDTGLEAATRYYYRIRAINANNASSLIQLNSPGNVVTSAAPTAPAAPSNLVATPLTATSVNLTWNDNSGVNESGFEIQKSSQPNSGFVTLVITAANVTSFVDTQVSGHSTVYYQVRARNLSAQGVHSAYTTPASSATTPNRSPSITDVANRSMFTGSNATIDVIVTDPDTDPISFSFITNSVAGLPGFATFQSDGFGRGVITITGATAGTYDIQINGSDGIATATDNFQIVVGTNHSPVLPAIANQTTEEGRMGTTFQIAAATDADAGQTLTYSTSTLPSFITFNASNRTFTYNPTATPATAGVYSITVTVRDNASPVNGLDSKTFSLVVLPLDNFFTISMNFVSSNTGISGYTPANYYENAPWNNTGSPSATAIPNLKDDAGNTVRFVTMNTGTSWQDSNPVSFTLTSDPNTLYTKKIRESFFKRNSANATTITFNNLNPALNYKVTIYGAGPTSGGSTATALTKYIVTGSGAGETVTLANGNNATNTVSTQLTPATGGTLSIRVSRNDETVSGTGAYFINALILTAQYPAPVPPDAPSGLTLSAPTYNTVNVSWTDNSFNETSFEILRSSTLNGTYNVVAGGSVAANQTSFTDNSVTGRTTYYYKVRAVNSFGSASTSALVITTPNGAPVIANPGTITVRVGETLQHNINATDPENDPITFATQNLPAFATLIDNGNGTGFIRLIPQQNDIGSYSFTLRANDNFSAQSEVLANIIVLDAEADEAIFINFNNSVESFTAPWNNKNVNSASAALSNTAGQVSAVQLTKSTWTGNDTGGVNTGNNSGLYPDNIISSFWSTTGTGTISLTGLDNSKRYNLTIFGSRNEFWFGNTVYTITTGSVPAPTAKTLNTTKNKSNTIRFTGVQPSGGSIVFTAQKGAALGGSVVNRDACINAMVIESYTPGTTPRKPTNLSAEGASKTSIKLTWNDNSSDETGFEVSRTATQGGTFAPIATLGANVETYTDSSLPQNTAYIYRVRALKSTGTDSDYTNEAMATTFNQIILVNLNYSTAGGHMQAPSPWNNTSQVPVEGMIFSNFSNDASGATPVDMTILHQGSGSGNETGFYDGNGIYPDAVLANYYYFEQFEAPNQYQLSQLDNNYSYDLVFLGDEWGYTQSNFSPVGTNSRVATDYTVGATTISQFNGKNSTERVSIKNIKPEPDNTITFEIKCNDEARYGVWNALEIRSYTPLNATFDTEPPSIPQNLAASNITDVSFQIAWSPSTDNIGVASYEVFLGSDLVATVPAPDTFAILSNLQPATTYSVSVRAVDIKGNRSGFSNALQVTTQNSSTEAVDYYPTAIGDITQLTTWGTNPDGSGTNPSSFTLNNQHFNLTRNATINAGLTISGTNSKLIVDTAAILTVNNTLVAIVDINHNGSAIVNTGTPPIFGTLANTSTVTFIADPSAVPGANYGNLVLDGSNSTKVFSAGTYVVHGDLQVADGVMMNGSSGNNTILNIAGNLTLLGGATAQSDNQLLSLNFNSGATQNITATDNEIRFHQILVSDTTTLTVNSGATPKSITLGTSNGGGLIVENESVLNIGKNSLTVEGTGAINSLNQTGRLRVSKAAVQIESTGSQVSNLYFATGYDTLQSLQLNANPTGQVNIRSRMYVKEVINLVNGRLHSQDNIVLVSDATGTARISKIGNTGVFLGKVEFQRHFSPKGRVYRYVSTPVYGTTVDAWDNHLPIVGPFSGSSNSNTTNSMFYYDSDNGGWVGYPNSSSLEVVNVGLGYSLFVFNGSTEKKLRIQGPIQQGNFTFNNLATDLTPETTESDVAPLNGWNLLGNPYASPIRWVATGWQSTGLNGSVYVRSNEVINNVVVTTNLVWNGVIGSLPKGIIAQGQSFWVKATGVGTPTLLITEDAKYDTLSATFQREESPRNYLELTLVKGALKDKTFLHFTPQATDNFDEGSDAYKLANNFFNLSSKVGLKDVAINSMAAAFCEKRIPLNLQNATTGQYILSFTNLNSFEYDIQVRLIDHFKSSETAVSEGSQYSFDVTSDPQSFGSSRFELLFNKPELDQQVAFNYASTEFCGDGNAVITLNNTQRGVKYQIVHNQQVVKVVKGNGNNLTFGIESQALREGVNNFTVMAAFDGCEVVTLPSTTTINYVKKPVITLQDNTMVSSYAGTTQWLLDGNVIPGATGSVLEPEVSGEYSVLAIGNSCEAKSDPVLFAITGIEQPGSHDFTIYPNPVRNHFLVKVPQVKSGEPIVLQIYNTLGMVVGEYQVVNRKEGFEINTERLGTGLYTLRISAKHKQLEKRFIRE
jgi:poly(3-hydroxybutyrate) depolymerase